jgi:hypothetical protein
MNVTPSTILFFCCSYLNLRRLCYLLSLAVVLLSTSAWSAETASEGHDPNEEKIAKSIHEGSLQWLKAGDKEILSWYFPSIKMQPVGAVILIPDQNETIAGVDVLIPLRKRFLEAGYAVLVVSMPEIKAQMVQIEPASSKTQLAVQAQASSDAADPDIAQYAEQVNSRLDAALQFVRQSNFDNILIVGHGTGGYWGVNYLVGKKPDEFKKADKGPWIAIIMVSGYTPHSTVLSSFVQQQILSGIKFPILDIKAQIDYGYVNEQVKERLQIVQKSKDLHYRQAVIDSVDYHYSGAGEALTVKISGWARRQRAIEKAEEEAESQIATDK